jgi:hypothetical protein
LQNLVQFVFNNHPTIPRYGLYEFFKALLNKVQKKKDLLKATRVNVKPDTVKV